MKLNTNKTWKTLKVFSIKTKRKKIIINAWRKYGLIEDFHITSVFKNKFLNVELNLHKKISNNAQTHFTQYMSRPLNEPFSYIPQIQ